MEEPQFSDHAIQSSYSLGHKIIFSFFDQIEIESLQVDLITEFNNFISDGKYNYRKAYDILWQFFASESIDEEFKLVLALALRRATPEDIVSVRSIFRRNQYFLELDDCKKVVLAFIEEGYKPSEEVRPYVIHEPQASKVAALDFAPAQIVDSIEEEEVGVIELDDIKPVMKAVDTSEEFIPEQLSQEVLEENDENYPTVFSQDALVEEITLIKENCNQEVIEEVLPIPDALNEEERAMKINLMRHRNYSTLLENFKKRIFSENIDINYVPQCFFVAMTALSHNKQDPRNKRFKVFKLLLRGMNKNEISEEIGMHPLDVESHILNANNTCKNAIEKRYPSLTTYFKRRK